MRVIVSGRLAAVLAFVMFGAPFTTLAQTVARSGVVIDFPSLVGESPEEIEKRFGKPTQTKSGSRLQPHCDKAHWYKVGGQLQVCFRRGRAVALGYNFESKEYPGTPEAALLLVGLDVGQTPPLQAATRPMAGAPSGPLGGLGGKQYNLFWEGSFGGVEWQWVMVQGHDGRNGRSLLSKGGWGPKQRYYSVAAYIAEGL